LRVRLDQSGRIRRLRIDGIDAPEICQPGGQTARALLAQRVLHHRVSITTRRHDFYGRDLAQVWLDGDDVGARMVRSGQAWSYRWRRDTGPYGAEENLARQSHLGLFAASAPELPRDFRKRHGPCYATHQ
jgi:endonuclease YncB( thermonuclease family)